MDINKIKYSNTKQNQAYWNGIKQPEGPKK